MEEERIDVDKLSEEEVNNLKTEDKFYINQTLRSNLEALKKLRKKKFDIVGIYDGREREGKSVKAAQDCYFMNPNFNLDNFAFTPFEFREKLMKADFEDSIQYDEAYSGLSSRGTLSYINKTLVSLSTQIGRKRLFVAIVLPSFFELDRYIAIHRGNYLIHVKTRLRGDSIERGFFYGWPWEEKKDLYLMGKKFYNHFAVKPPMRGRFPKWFPVNEKEYEDRKEQALTKIEDYVKIGAITAKQSKWISIFLKLIIESGWKHSDIMDYLRKNNSNMAKSTYYQYFNRISTQNEAFS